MKKIAFIATLCLGINGCIFLKNNVNVKTDSFYSQISNLSIEKIGHSRNIKTIENPFFEKYIYSYLSQGSIDEVIAKQGGFVASKPISIKTYKDGYYIINMKLLSKFKKMNKDLNIDSAAVMKLFVHLDSIQYSNDENISDINPFCGGRYRQLNLNIKSLYLCDVQQRLPLFLSCDGYKNYAKAHNGRNYEVYKIPTYLIINVQ